MSFDAEVGPISYVVAAFPTTPLPTDGLDRLLRLVDEGRILVLDVEFVTRGDDGRLAVVGAAEVGAPQFDGASAGLVDADDIALVGESLEAGGVGVIVVYEELTMLPVLEAWAAEGATLVSEGPVVLDDLVETLDTDDEQE